MAEHDVLTIKWDDVQKEWMGSVGDARGWQALAGHLKKTASFMKLVAAGDNLAEWEGWKIDRIHIPERKSFSGRKTR